MKRKIIVSIIVLIITSMLLLIIPKNKEDILYAVTIDGKKANNFPEHGNYNVNVKCDNATGVWNYTKWIVDVTEITGDYICEVAFTTSNKQNLNDYIISLNNQEVGDGIVTNENGYRYEGSNPNNYILFNDELWRIIGVFDQTTHGVNSNLVKIIRNDDIGGLVYDAADNDINSWGESTLYKLLNQETGGSYYMGIDYTNKSNGTYCSGYKGYTPQDCTFSKKGIRSDYARSMIKKAKWYSTAYDTIGTVSDTYVKDTTAITNTEGYIGLMYPSDYGYAVKASDCERTISLDSYGGTISNSNGLACAGKDWLKSGDYEYTLSRYNVRKLWFIRFSGEVYDDTGIYFASVVRPTLYLKSDVYYVGGSGSYDDPIIIGY